MYTVLYVNYVSISLKEKINTQLYLQNSTDKIKIYFKKLATNGVSKETEK